VLSAAFGPRELLELMSLFELTVSMRLHFVIFAALRGVPVIGLPYASKVSAFLRGLGIEPPPLVREGHSGVLLAAIDRLWDAREAQRELLADQVPVLKQRARETTALVAGLIPRHTSVRPAA
jgi:polysaccharide pyruvyl transferase WcaK-like protein